MSKKTTATAEKKPTAESPVRDTAKAPVNARLKPEEKVELHRKMVRIRRFEERSLRAYQAKKIGGFLHLYIGQEAVAVGCCSLMGKNDHVITAYRDHGHAIADVVTGTDGRGRIMVTTRRDGEFAVITIADTGAGIPADVRERIFEPFFTTKGVGRGTGQGLAISRSVIMEKHRGALTFDSEVGKGTTFVIRLPIDGAAGTSQSAA